MSWANFGQQLFLNASHAAGTLAEFKLELRAADQEDRQIALQEGMHKAQVAYRDAKIAFDKWATTQEHAIREEEMQYKQELLEWQRGTTQRKTDAAQADRQRRIDALEALKEQNPELADVYDRQIAAIQTETPTLSHDLEKHDLLKRIDESDASPELKELQKAVILEVPGAKEQLQFYTKRQAILDDPQFTPEQKRKLLSSLHAGTHGTGMVQDQERHSQRIKEIEARKGGSTKAPTSAGTFDDNAIRRKRVTAINKALTAVDRIWEQRTKFETWEQFLAYARSQFEKNPGMFSVEEQTTIINILRQREDAQTQTDNLKPTEPPEDKQTDDEGKEDEQQADSTDA